MTDSKLEHEVDDYTEFQECYETMDPTLSSVIDQESLRWVFVGGKGGVGKTTCSCSLAIQLASVRPSVLIVSTDPAHNISDAFDQKFSGQPSIVNGFKNLYAMEVNPVRALDTISNSNNPMLKNLMSTFPGIDEAFGFVEILNVVKEYDFSIVVFDTAPTGHTLRFLAIPKTFQNILPLFSSPLGQQFSGAVFNQFASSIGLTPPTTSPENSVRETLPLIQSISEQFKDNNLTTFVCVCIAEFLSLYETERLIQELVKFGIDSQNIIVNQLLFPSKDKGCDLCMARQKIQQKYLDQIHLLYEDFHILKLPLLPFEVRGVKLLKQFSEYLLKGYVPP